jgi:hypothetical protein
VRCAFLRCASGAGAGILLSANGLCFFLDFFSFLALFALILKSGAWVDRYFVSIAQLTPNAKAPAIPCVPRCQKARGKLGLLETKGNGDYALRLRFRSMAPPVARANRLMGSGTVCLPAGNLT